MNETSQSQHIKTWLYNVIRQPISTPVSTFFYYDSKDNAFFSILSIDYFLFDENYTIPSGTKSSYSGEDTIVLADRMKRIEENDSSIIYISPKGITNPDKLEREITFFLSANCIDINTSMIWEVGANENNHSTITPTPQAIPDVIEPKRSKWWKFW